MGGGGQANVSPSPGICIDRGWAGAGKVRERKSPERCGRPRAGGGGEGALVSESVKWVHLGPEETDGEMDVGVEMGKHRRGSAEGRGEEGREKGVERQFTWHGTDGETEGEMKQTGETEKDTERGSKRQRTETQNRKDEPRSPVSRPSE